MHKLNFTARWRWHRPLNPAPGRQKPCLKNKHQTKTNNNLDLVLHFAVFFLQGQHALGLQNHIFTQSCLFVAFQIQDKHLSEGQSSFSYVYLEVVSKHFSKSEKRPILYDNGSLFVHTDKPVYTPQQHGRVSDAFSKRE